MAVIALFLGIVASIVLGELMSGTGRRFRRAFTGRRALTDRRALTGRAARAGDPPRAAAPETAESALVTMMLAGLLTRDAYQRQMARLAAEDELRRPLAVPPVPGDR